MRLFPTATYENRRKQLSKAVGSGLILLMGNNEAPMNYEHNIYRFRQDSSFLYFFGLKMPGLAAIIDCDSGEEIIYGREYTMDDIIWVGPQSYTLAEYARLVGVDTVHAPDQLPVKLGATRGRPIHYLPPYRYDNKLSLRQWLGTMDQPSTSLIKAVIDQRSIKSDEEVREMEHAVNVTREIHINAMKSIRHGKKEYESVAEIYRTAKANNCYLAYPAIFSINGQTLHNHHHHNTMTDGRLVINDSGAENDMCYAGDITRTMPVSGKYSTKQKEIYNLVLDMEVSSIAALKPGLPYRDVHIRSNKIMLKGLKGLGLLSGDVDEMSAAGVGGLFMPHGLGHMIGLDVHDMEDLGEDKVGYDETFKRSTQLGLKSLRLARELQAGFVITVEPGIYFIPELIEKWKADGKHKDFINYDKLERYYDFGGIRIEDDVLITDSSSKVLGAPIPKTITEIEQIMNS